MEKLETDQENFFEFSVKFFSVSFFSLILESEKESKSIYYSVFVDANRLRMSVLVEILCATSVFQALGFLKGWRNFLLGSETLSYLLSLTSRNCNPDNGINNLIHIEIGFGFQRDKTLIIPNWVLEVDQNPSHGLNITAAFGLMSMLNEVVDVFWLELQNSFTMSLLSKLWCITVDVIGTLLAYKGELRDYYCMVAKVVGLECLTTKKCMKASNMHIKTWPPSIHVSGMVRKWLTSCGGKLVSETPL
ncbi:hypothetical protein DVH24_019929 [Malus domestica]|uniref:Uncharacterized protein n=1 Tax=Malus domestica TaxID=3750 RepID=A0A498I6B0_MALDO|nr:hypothetical protein DVH24_019929 [Malus domestica]